MNYTTKIMGNKIQVQKGKVTLTIEKRKVTFEEPGKITRSFIRLNLPIEEMKSDRKELEIWVNIIFSQFYQ